MIAMLGLSVSTHLECLILLRQIHPFRSHSGQDLNRRIPNRKTRSELQWKFGACFLECVKVTHPGGIGKRPAKSEPYVLGDWA